MTPESELLMHPDHTPDTPRLKQCSKCKAWKPATTFYFRVNRRAGDGFYSHCKRCLGVGFRYPRQELHASIDGYRVCVICHREKPATEEFFYWRSRKKGQLRRECKECRKGYQKVLYENNPSARIEYVARWQRHNPDKMREYRQTRREKYPNEKREKYWANPEHFRESNRNWAKNNRERHRQIQKRTYEKNKERWKLNRRIVVIRRRARKKELSNTFTTAEWQAAIDYFGGYCAACGRPPGLFHALAMDHWIPLSSPDCPGTVATNIIPLCHGIDGCNQSKHRRDGIEWLVEKFGKVKAKQIHARIEAYFLLHLEK